MSDKQRFPFPFTNPVFQYSNNLRPLEPAGALQITGVYKSEMSLKRQLLQKNPHRCYQSLPQTMKAQWEVLDYVLHELSDMYPEFFHLKERGSEWSFTNRLLEENTEFVFAHEPSLQMEPLDFVGRQVQEDLILMSQVESELFLDAGQLCFPSNWSLTFDLGMPFVDIHRPVPGLVEDGLVGKIQRFLTRIEAGKPWTRLNWSVTAGGRLDTAAESFDEWGSTRYQIDEQNVASMVHLRVEEQCLIRMPTTQSVLFTIHTYVKPIHEVCQNRDWCRLFYGVVRTLTPEIVDYKGLAPFYNTLLRHLETRV